MIYMMTHSYSSSKMARCFADFPFENLLETFKPIFFIEHYQNESQAMSDLKNFFDEEEQFIQELTLQQDFMLKHGYVTAPLFFIERK